MLTKEQFLDRMEILYPDDPRLSDLRRAYIDRDLSSLFRLFQNFYGDNANEMRKAVIEQNLYSIFRIFEYGFDLEHHSSNIELTDLRKFILEDNEWSMYRLLSNFHDSQIIHTIKNLQIKDISWDPDAVSQGQLKSKIWLIKELKNLDLDLGTVFLCAGWYGILATLIFEHGLKVEKIRSFDIDPDVVHIADKFNSPWLVNDWQFKAATYDIHDIDYTEFRYDVVRNDGSICTLQDRPDTIINTSCEHIENFDRWFNSIPLNRLVILQSNNYMEVDEHVNPVKSLNDFTDATPLSRVLYQGKLNLPKYTRYMRIGYK